MQTKSINVKLLDASNQKLASSFCSGNNYLDRFLKSSDALDNGFGKTYVLLSDDESAIIGYYNLGVGYIEQISERARVKIGGSAHINCFALDERYHHILHSRTDDGTNIYLSDLLLYDCIERIQAIRSEAIGFSFVTLCSTEQGHYLYQRNDFEDLEKDMAFSIGETDKECRLMYYPLDYE